MRLSNKITLCLGIISLSAFANAADDLLLKNIEINDTDVNILSIQNLSKEHIEIDIYGTILSLSPISGVNFDCVNNAYLELQVKNNNHDYFEVQCQSRVIFTENFTNEIKLGE